MTTSEHEKRVHTRFAARLRAVLHLPDGKSVEAHTRDLSMGGAFIETPLLLPYDTHFILALELPSLDGPARLPATVRWSTSTGIGIAFGTLRAVDAWAINILESEAKR